MRILFLNIAWMERYAGVNASDVPMGGGSYVEEYMDAHESYNFKAEEVNFENGSESGIYCLGFVETKHLNNERNQMHIEKIRGCELLNNDTKAEDVLVVWCAKHPAHRFTTVVGWYKHATVYRYHLKADFDYEEGEGIYTQYFNVMAKADDCVLLPVSLRSRKVLWEVPRKKANGRTYGFGQSNVWFASEKENSKLEEYLKQLEQKINEYNGENWVTNNYK